jgi:hypothetical protein
LLPNEQRVDRNSVILRRRSAPKDLAAERVVTLVSMMGERLGMLATIIDA